MCGARNADYIASVMNDIKWLSLLDVERNLMCFSVGSYVVCFEFIQFVSITICVVKCFTIQVSVIFLLIVID